MAENVKFSRVPQAVRDAWQRVRDAVAGGAALRRPGAPYLPTLNPTDTTEANLARNRAYVDRAVYLGATGATLEGLMGLAFRVDPSTDLTDPVRPLLRNADGGGVSLYQQSQQSLSHLVATGRHGLLADWSEALAAPVIKTYWAEDIWNWRHEMVDGESVLSLLMLRERVTRPKGGDRFELEEVEQYREFWREPGGAIMSRLWSPSVAGGALVEGAPIALGARLGAQLTEIPFVCVGSKTNDFSFDPAPLAALAEVNLAHYRNSADYEDTLFLVGQAQPWIAGLDDQSRNFLLKPYIEDVNGNRTDYPAMYWGSRSPMLLPPGATVGIAQVEPNDMLRQAMQDKQEQMRALGARLIEASEGSKTATGENNDREASTSVLSLCVSNVNEAYQTALAFCAMFAGRPMTEQQQASSYKITQDFTRVTADPAVLAQMVAMWQTGVIAKADVQDYTRRVGLVATERTNELIDGDVEAEGPALPEPEPLQPAPGGPEQL